MIRLKIIYILIYMILFTIIAEEIYLIYHCIMAVTKKLKMEPENWLAMIRTINALFQLITFIGKKTKDKYKIQKKRVYWTRYMTWTNRRHLFKNKGNFVYNYKLKKFEHMSKTSMCNDYCYLQAIRKDLFRDILVQKLFYLLSSCKHSRRFEHWLKYIWLDAWKLQQRNLSKM